MLHPDFKDLLSVLAAEEVEYLIIGGYAVGFHAKPRFTKDIDLWVRDETENLARLAGREQDLKDVRALEHSRSR